MDDEVEDTTGRWRRAIVATPMPRERLVIDREGGAPRIRVVNTPAFDASQEVGAC